jgi:hypothetical protein
MLPSTPHVPRISGRATSVSTSESGDGDGDVGRRGRGRVDHVAAGRRVSRPPVRAGGCFWLPGTRRADWVPYPGRGDLPRGGSRGAGQG